jgi:hypothetical protein
VIGIALGAFVVVHQRDVGDTVYGSWLESSRVPPDILSGDQPRQGTDGVRHTLTNCRVDEGDLLYSISFENRYDAKLDAILAVSIDTKQIGSVWGWFEIELPSGLSRTELGTHQAPDPIRDRVRAQQEEAAGKGSRAGCSVHLVGFRQGVAYAVHYPLSTNDLTR